jgi:menaquinol-cytochrome c reductase iron-sulfur subunit
VAVPVAGFATAAGWRASTPIRLLGRSIPPTLQSDGWVSVGVLDDFEVGVPKRVIVQRPVTDGWVAEDAPVGAFILRRAARAVLAYDIHCTHLGCPVRYVEGARRFLCPCHGGQFNRNGDVVSGPPPRSLARFETKVEGDEIFLGALQEADG